MDEVEEKQKTVTAYGGEAITRYQNLCTDLEDCLGGRSVDEETMDHIRQEVTDAEAEHQLTAETHGIAKMKHEEFLE